MEVKTLGNDLGRLAAGAEPEENDRAVPHQHQIGEGTPDVDADPVGWSRHARVATPGGRRGTRGTRGSRAARGIARGWLLARSGRRG